MPFPSPSIPYEPGCVHPAAPGETGSAPGCPCPSPGSGRRSARHRSHLAVQCHLPGAATEGVLPFSPRQRAPAGCGVSTCAVCDPSGTARVQPGRVAQRAVTGTGVRSVLCVCVRRGRWERWRGNQPDNDFGYGEKCIRLRRTWANLSPA